MWRGLSPIAWEDDRKRIPKNPLFERITWTSKKYGTLQRHLKTDKYNDMGAITERGDVEDRFLFFYVTKNLLYIIQIFNPYIGAYLDLEPFSIDDHY